MLVIQQELSFAEIGRIHNGIKRAKIQHEAIECGHYIQEEVPEKVIQHFTSFFKV